MAVNAIVSCCQVTPALGNPAANRELAADAISDAAAQGASVVVLPELVSRGYVFDSRADAQASAEAADGATVTLWARLAADHGVVIVGGFCETTAAGELFNSAALVDSGGLRCAAPAADRTIIVAECRLDEALDKSISPISNVHADRRPELYRLLAE